MKKSDGQRILLLEDMDADAELVIRSAERDGIVARWHHARTREDFERALATFAPDIVLADYSLPGFDGKSALEAVQSRLPGVPVIIVSGSLVDETALDLIRSGAIDYVLKSNLRRLALSIQRALAEADDVRERRRAEQLLRESEARFREIVETAQEGIWIIGDGQSAYMNRRMVDMLALDAGGTVLPSVADVVDPDSRPGFDARVAQLASGPPGAERFECQLRRADGSRVWASIAMSRTAGTPGTPPGFLAMVTDVTAQRHLQEQLMVADRMASVGMLAASVAHEINNPLAAMMANLQLAIPDAGSGRPCDELVEELSESLDCADRIRLIVRDLRVFGRTREEREETVDVRGVLEAALRLARNEIHHRARERRSIAAVPGVKGDEARLVQVFLNLLVNAAQAIEPGHADRNEISVDVRLDGPDRVQVEIGDTGSGMAPEVLRQAFEPFFTTKPPGIGSGLGLAICKRILAGMGGEISLESDPGRGTRARVLLPVAPVAIPRDEAPRRVEAAPRRGRILVIDDEEILLGVVRRALENEHDVASETSGRAALGRIRAGEPFDVVLCDLMMPDMTGIDVLRELQDVRPGLAPGVVFMSGGAFTPEALRFLAEVPNARIEKPFDVQDLRHVVNELLRAAGGVHG